MASPACMISLGVVSVGDTVEFTFKSNYFSAEILRGGLVGNCRMLRANARTSEKILQHTTAFSSLTAWTEACLQDILEEYYTRYSSWKRVTHKESRRSMADLRDSCKLFDKKNEDSLEIHKELIRLQNTIDEMSAYIGKMERGEAVEPHKWTYTNRKYDVSKPEAKFDEKVCLLAQQVACLERTKESIELLSYF